MKYNITKKSVNAGFLLCLLLISAPINATNFRYSGKCQLAFSRVKYAYCLQKELVSYDKEFNILYSNLTPEQSIAVTDALSTQLIEPDCDALAKQFGEGLEYHIVNRTCLIHIAKERIACLRQFTSNQNALGRKIVNGLKAPFVLLGRASILLSDPVF